MLHRMNQLEVDFPQKFSKIHQITCLSVMRQRVKGTTDSTMLLLTDINQKLSCDIFKFGTDIAVLIINDYFSIYFRYRILRDKSSLVVNDALGTMFPEWGSPEAFKTDNGSQFISENKRTLRSLQYSPYYELSNEEPR